MKTCDIKECDHHVLTEISGPFQYCDEHLKKAGETICNSKYCNNHIAPEDYFGWILCPYHKKMCETREGYKELGKIGYKTDE